MSHPSQHTLTARSGPAGALGLALVMLAVACGDGLPAKHSQDRVAEARESGVAPAIAHPQVVLIAIDGLEPTLLNDLLAEGRLPNIERLVENGSQATIDCVVGTTSPVVWTTVITGVEPRHHGIVGFNVGEVPVTSTLRKLPALWNMLPAYGLTSAFFGWFVSWPAENDSGIIVSDRAFWGRFEDKIAPAGVLDLKPYHYNGKPDPGLLQGFTTWPYDPGFEDLGPDHPLYAPNFLVYRRLLNALAHDNAFVGMAEELLAAEPRQDVVGIYFQAADYTSHGFWKYHEPRPFREAGWAIDETELEHLGGVVTNTYGYLDGLVGRVLDQVDDEALVILLSDHGFGPGLGPHAIDGDYLSGNHRDQGVLILSGPNVRRGFEQPEPITHFDILPTVLFALGLPLAEDMPGRPLLPYFEEDARASWGLRQVASHATGGVHGEPVMTSDHDEQIMDELRSLGYVK
jgi:arylsulfatase A-like enzyme